MNIFLMLLAFMFMGGYYYFFSPAMFIKSETKEEVVELAPIKTLISCMNKNHQDALNDNEVNSRPNNFNFIPTNLCSAKYNVTSVKVCLLDNKITDECYPSINSNSVPSHYVITKSSFLKSNKAGRLIEIIQNKYSNKINLGYVSMHDDKLSIVASGKTPIEIPNEILKFANVNAGDIISFSEITPRNYLSDDKPICLSSDETLFFDSVNKKWICKNKTMVDICLGNTEFDSSSNKCIANRPNCPDGYVAELKNDSWECVAPKTKKTCKAGKVLFYNHNSPYSDKYECIDDPTKKEAPGACQTVSPDGEITDLKYSPMDYGCTPCETINNTFCNSETNLKPFCIPDSNQITNSQCMDSLELQNCVNDDEKNPTKSIVFNFPDTNYIQNILNSDDYAISKIAPEENLSNYTKTKPYFKFSCLDCSPLVIDTAKSKYPYYATCKKAGAGTQETLCNDKNTKELVWAIKSSENKSGIVCQNVNEFDDSTYNSIFDGCPYGYVRGGSAVNYACRPNWCDNASNGADKIGSNAVKCPDSDKNGGSIMVVLDKTGYYSSGYFETLAEYKNNVCIYCWKPSFAVPELKSVNTSKSQITTTPLRYTYHAIFNSILSSSPTQNPKTTTSSSTNGIIPLIASITSKYINLDKFGKLDIDSFKNTDVFDENGNYQGLDNIEFKASKSKLYIPIPQNILQKLYTYGGEVFLPCPTLNQYGQCNNYSSHLFSRPGQIREWVAITDSIKTNYWWKKLLDEKNTEDDASDFVNRWWNSISVGEVDDYAKFYGNFTPTGDLNISYAVSYPLPFGAGITKTKVKIGNTAHEVSFENPYTENSNSNSLFPYYGCETKPEGFDDNCENPCFDIIVNESSKFHEFTKAERLAIFNPAKYFFKSASSSISSYRITTLDDYQMLSASGSANQIYLRTKQCPVVSSETTAGCPPYMIRYWDNNAWSACVYNICNNNKTNNLDWANNLANGKKQGFIYYKDSDNNCVGIAQPSTVNGDDNSDKFISRSGTAYQRLVEYDSSYRKYSNLVWYQTSDLCPYGSYYYWNDDYGWVGCVYNFMTDSEISNLNSGVALNNDNLWGFYSPALAGTKKITKENQSIGSIWDPTAESFEKYANRRGLNTSKNSNRIVMLSKNISGTTTKQNVPSLYLWTPPAWVAIEDKKSESNTTDNFFVNSVNSVVNNGESITEYSVVSPLTASEDNSLTNANVGTFNKTGTTLKTFISSMSDFTQDDNKIEYLQNTSNNASVRTLAASDLENVQNHFMTPEYIINTAKKINSIKSSHYDSALFGPNRLFYKDIEYFLSDEMQNQIVTTGKMLDYTNTSISDYGCFAGYYVKYKNDSWANICEDIEYCSEADADNSDKSGYIALIRNSVQNNGKICIEFAIPDPEIYEENLESETTTNNGFSTYNCTQILGHQNTTISNALSSISSYTDSNNDNSNCLNKDIINCVNYECPETCETAKCRQCCKTTEYQTIPVELYNGIPGVYRFLLTKDINLGMDDSGNNITEKQTSWSEPFINWCDSEYVSKQHSGYIASYFYNDKNPFNNNDWKTANNLKTKQISINNLFNNFSSNGNQNLTLPCLYLWKPNITNVSVFSACAGESSDWDKIKCVIKSAVGIDYNAEASSLIVPNSYTCTSTNCFSINDVYGVKIPNEISANTFAPSQSTNTYAKTDISGFVHRFNDLINISWNASPDPVFCADIINLSNSNSSIHQAFCSGRGDNCTPNIISDLSVSLSGISPFTEGMRRLNNDNSCKLDNPFDIPNNCWNFGNLLHDDDMNWNHFTYFAHDLEHNCITLGWRKNQITSLGVIDSKYKDALINQHSVTFNSTIIDKLPICGDSVNCSLENSTLYNCEDANISNITPEHWNKYWKCLILKSQTNIQFIGSESNNEFIISSEQLKLLKKNNENIINGSNNTIYLCNTNNFTNKTDWEPWMTNIKVCDGFLSFYSSN